MSDAILTGLVTGVVAVLGTVVGTLTALLMSRQQSKREVEARGVDSDRGAVAELVRALRSLSVTARGLGSLSRQGRDTARRTVEAGGTDYVSPQEAQLVMYVDAEMGDARRRFWQEIRTATLAMPAVIACGDGRISAFAFESGQAMNRVSEAVSGLGNSLAEATDESWEELTDARQALNEHATLMLAMVAAPADAKRRQFRSQDEAAKWLEQG